MFSVDRTYLEVIGTDALELSEEIYASGAVLARSLQAIVCRHIFDECVDLP